MNNNNSKIIARKIVNIHNYYVGKITDVHTSIASYMTLYVIGVSQKILTNKRILLFYEEELITKIIHY